MGRDKDSAQSGPKLGAALILCTRRNDRRTVFAALDQMGLSAIYTAPNLAKGISSIEDDEEINIVILDLDISKQGVQTFGDFLSTRTGANRLHVIGLMPEPGTKKTGRWKKVPEFVDECVRTPIDLEEFQFRLLQVQDMGKRVAAPELAGDSEARGSYDGLFDLIRDECLLVDPQSQAIVRVNRQFETRSGFSAEDFLGRPIYEVFDESDVPHEGLANARLNRGGSASYQALKRCKNGSSYPVEVLTTLDEDGGEPIYFISIRDISRQTHTLQALEILSAASARIGEPALSQEVFTRLANWLDLDFMFLGLFDKGDGGQVIPREDYKRSQISGNLCNEADHPAYKRLRQGQLVCARSDASRVLGPDDFLERNKLQSYIGIPLSAEGGRVSGALIVASTDPIENWEVALTTLRIMCAQFSTEFEFLEFQEDSRHKGTHDELTGLANRTLFNKEITKTIKAADRSGEVFAVLFVDLDRFKPINDSLGHNVGDQVLRGVAEKLQASVRATDLVGRHSGDEFTVLLRHVASRQVIEKVASKINNNLNSPIQVETGSELQVTASIGISIYPNDGETPTDLIKNADIAMYSAKGMGRNTFEFYVSDDQDASQQKLLLENKLRTAQEKGELRAYYQPQVSAFTEDIIGMESLIRWEHPELGLISPGFFVPLAEETGLIIEIGEWILRQSCIDSVAWEDRFGLGLRVGVNLSILQLMQPDLPKVVASILKETGLNPGLLELEITESLNISNFTQIAGVITELKDMGCGVALDDFGTGQSSLDYLKRLPADRIKLDQSFVRNIGIDPDDEAILEATVRMAQGLGRGVIAEGVEEESQLKFLRNLGCPELQGFLFCRPLERSDFENLLAQREQLLNETILATEAE